ncbi:PREDICTED: pentatricopeptide repeat-containing protein At1g63080, mitochondrial-like [Populus euphratica]|uniref:Pentatricopeptide repeat-containing protein At1g63080, mitochondrial-like n=1 Tax=Populus euphratica TaxID=75702 RepID=A0AAJ6XD01_POPEU|nr:PREDICTED: pentatricopeptide repeat-containing protein At1g63080, mitochondrial-like [Populus euphratica]
MRLHLISTGTFDEEGYHNYFEDGKWKFSRNSLIVAKEKKMGLYMSQVKVFNIFKDFHARVEIETSRKLKRIRADNGGEYRGSFEKYCREHGIKYNARLVVKGFGQKKGIDFEEIFSLVVKMSLMRVVLGLAASLNLEVEQLDMKTAFLYDDLDEIQMLKEEFNKSFAIKDLGPIKQIFGMKITRDRKKGKLWLSQERYIQKIFRRFNMSNFKPVCSPLARHFKLSYKQYPSSDEEKDEMKKVLYASAVGSLMYVMVCTRSNIAYAIGVGKIARAVEFFDEMVERGYQPNLHTYTTIIKGLCKIGKTPVAVGLLKKMDNAGCQPNVVTYSTLIDSLCKDRLIRLEEASALFNEMMSFNILPDVVTFNILVDTLCKKGKISEAQRIFKTMIEKGVEPNTVTYSLLMNGYLLQNRVFEARKVFDAMITRGCINILVDTLCKKGKISEAQRIFKTMIEKGVEPNTVTYSLLMNGYLLQNRVLEARKAFDAMLTKGSGLYT